MKPPPDLDLLLVPGRIREIRDHALETHPEECCGVVRASGVTRFTNVQDTLHAEDPGAFPRTSRTAFRPSDAEQLLLARSFDTDDPVRVLYHSHHDAAAGAGFSDEDRLGATMDGEPLYPALLHLVVDVRTGDDGRPHVAGSRLHAWDGTAFGEIARFAAR